MDAEKVLNFFDWFWFQRRIFGKEPDFSFSSSSEANPNGENGLQPLEEVISLPRTGKSTGDSQGSQTISTSGSLSPNSVLSTSKLRSLFSDITDFENSKPTPVKAALEKMKVGESETRRRCDRKSLSELEYEELKGFRDLGFVFSEDDRNSSLASIIPGLHRLGRKKGLEEEEEEVSDESNISRPYLSEAWEDLALDRRRIENPLLKNWKLPSLSNEADMKENLRWWAHTVASAVR